MNKNMRIKKTAAKHVLYIAVLALYLVLMRLLDIDCIIKHIIGMPCSTCGVTRSLWSFLLFDFKGAARFHLLSPFVASALWLGVHSSLFKKWKKTVDLYIIITAVAVFLYYFIRIATKTLP